MSVDEFLIHPLLAAIPPFRDWYPPSGWVRAGLLGEDPDTSRVCRCSRCPFVWCDLSHQAPGIRTLMGRFACFNPRKENPFRVQVWLVGT